MMTRTNYAVPTLSTPPSLAWSKSIFLSLAMLCIATACSSLAWADTTNVPLEGLTENHAVDDWDTNYTTNATSGTAPLTFNVTGVPSATGKLIYSGTINDGEKANVSLTVSDSLGYGALVFTQKQNYSGTTTNQYSIVLKDAGTLGSGDVILSGASSIDFQGNGYKDSPFAQNIGYDESREGDNSVKFTGDCSDMEVTGNIKVTGDIKLTCAKTFTLSGTNTCENLTVGDEEGEPVAVTLNLSGTNTVNEMVTNTGTIVISDTGSLSAPIIQNVGEIVISDTGSLSSDCFLNAGTLEFQGTKEFSSNILAGSIVYSGEDALTISGAISDYVVEDEGTEYRLPASLSVTGTGTLTLSEANEYTDETTISNGTLALSAKNSIATSSKVTNNGTINMTAAQTLKNLEGSSTTATINAGANKLTITTDDGDIHTYAGKINSTGDVEKTGNGTLQLNGQASGDLKANKFTLASGGLDMKGFYTGTLDLEGGTFSPGNSIGDLEINGATNITGSALMTFEIASTSSHDHITTTSFNDGGYSNFISLAVTGSFEKDDEVELIRTSNITGTISNWLTTASAQDWQLVNHDDAVFAKYTAGGPEPGTGVPEPSTWALLILGCAGLMWYRKRERR